MNFPLFFPFSFLFFSFLGVGTRDMKNFSRGGDTFFFGRRSSRKEEGKGKRGEGLQGVVSHVNIRSIATMTMD
jgi:hypothetical protein